MRKDDRMKIWMPAVLWALLLVMPAPSMASHLPMPDLKGEFKKANTKGPSQIQLQADQVSVSTQDNKAHAEGNVQIVRQDQELFCDKLELDRVVEQAVAEGNVYLDTPNEEVMAQGMTYNFGSGTGEFRNAKVFADPYQIEGQRIDKVAQDHMSMDEGYMTTCDLDEPHYRIGAHRMDIYMKDKAVVHGMKIYLGKVPVMYLPYFEQDLKNRNFVDISPGESKDFGFFVLTTTHLKFGPHVQLNVHADARERDGLGEGADLKYDTPNFGSGLLSAYYTDENQIAGRHWWEEYKNGVKVGPTTHHERYRVIWRHRWQIGPNTDAVLQYYKIHDYDILNNGFLKTYFPRDYNQNAQNANLNTYFLLTHVMPRGTLTFDVDTSRENRPLRGIERIPEVRYVFNNQQIGRTGFYAKSTNTLSNLFQQNYPKTINNKTLRFDSNDDISHPFKLGFIQFNPHVGGEETYYSRTADVNDSDIIRGVFRTSLDMSTKFYKFWDYHTNFAGLDINGLRHVITPTITYLYQAKPTFPASELNQFDSGIDNVYRIHQVELGLENKLQTKRNGQIVDLVRYLVTTNYGLQGTTGHRGFNPVDTVLDFNPTNWFTLHNEFEYDFHAGRFDTENFDGAIHGPGWSLSLGNRYTHGQGDQLTSEFDYVINPKWRFRIYNTFPVTKATNGTTSARENEFVITRDLHEWEMDMAIDTLEGRGTTFYVLFRLKASPGMKLNLIDTTFQASKPGTQSQ